MLGHNFPNPFNPETTIQYQLGKRTFVRLEIYNLLGSRVRVMVDELQNTGEHRIIWDGLNDAGYPLAGGIYICQLKTEEFKDAIKMLLIR